MPTGGIFSNVIWFRRSKRNAASLAVEEMDLISSHCDKFLGVSPIVYHEVKSELIHLDLCHVPVVNGLNCQAIYTMGMSAREMPNLPSNLKYAECIMFLPLDWPPFDPRLSYDDMWPWKLIKQAAKAPFEMNLSILPGVTISNEDRIANTRFTAITYMPPVLVAPEFSEVLIGSKRVNFYNVCMMTSVEREWAVSQGDPVAFLDHLLNNEEAIGDFFIVSPHRADFVRS